MDANELFGVLDGDDVEVVTGKDIAKIIDKLETDKEGYHASIDLLSDSAVSYPARKLIRERIEDVKTELDYANNQQYVTYGAYAELRRKYAESQDKLHEYMEEPSPMEEAEDISWITEEAGKESDE
jgi:hypothetical protein